MSGSDSLRRFEGLGWEQLELMLIEMQELQKNKVTSLARRLKPGLTDEDLRNPHDFPELNDVDWHFEDGVLTGIESVLSAVRARRREV
jgi:hypothetical protein